MGVKWSRSGYSSLEKCPDSPLKCHSIKPTAISTSATLGAFSAPWLVTIHKGCNHNLSSLGSWKDSNRCFTSLRRTDHQLQVVANFRLVAKMKSDTSRHLWYIKNLPIWNILHWVTQCIAFSELCWNHAVVSCLVAEQSLLFKMVDLSNSLLNYSVGYQLFPFSFEKWSHSLYPGWCYF